MRLDASFPSMIKRSSSPALAAAAFGTAQGLGGAAVAAIAHRAVHASPSTATSMAAEPSLAPALRALNERLIRGLVKRLRSRPRGPRVASDRGTRVLASGARSSDDIGGGPSSSGSRGSSSSSHGVHQPDAEEHVEATAMRAWRNCHALRQGRLAVELYGAYRASACGGGLPTESAAAVIRWLGASLDSARDEAALVSAEGFWPARSGATGAADEAHAASMRPGSLQPSQVTRAAFLIAADAEARRRLGGAASVSRAAGGDDEGADEEGADGGTRGDDEPAAASSPTRSTPPAGRRASSRRTPRTTPPWWMRS